MQYPVRQAMLLATMTLLWVLPAQGAPMVRPQLPSEGCPVCELWLEYEPVVLLAQQEIGELDNGIVCFYHASDPAIIEPLIRFSYERQALEDRLAGNPELRAQLGGRCGHAVSETGRIILEISSSARGIFALISSSDPSTAKFLKLQGKQAVLSRDPVWF
jgi:hypothetical protein